MLSLCLYCEKKTRCKKLSKLYTALIKEQHGSPHYDIKVDVLIKYCNKFKKLSHKPTRAIHICLSCNHKDSCKLWEQVSWINEDFVKEKFEYNSDNQSVGVMVNYCKLYEPINQ